MVLFGDAERINIVKPYPRCREREEFLRFPKASPEGPLGLPADVTALGYKIRFTDEIAGGYKVNLLREDGMSALAKGISLRKYFFAWEKTVRDSLFDSVVALKLSSNSPAVLRITVMGEGEITPKSLKEAIEDLVYIDRHTLMGSALLLARAVSEGMCIRDAVPGLANCLGHHIIGVRVNAAFALAEFAKKSGDIGPAEDSLLGALAHPDGRTRRAAARALSYHYMTSGDVSGMDMMLNHPIGEIKMVARAVQAKVSAGI